MADTYNHRIRLVDLDLGKVTTLCGSGESGHVDGPCLIAKLNFPQKLALDISNNSKILYITELNDCVRVVDLIKREIYTLCGGF